MADTLFLKGSDFAVEINGSITGGVISAEVAEKDNIYDIKEFLSDSAVQSVRKTAYEITLTMNIPKEYLFSGYVNISELAFIQGNMRTEFSNPALLSVTDKAEGGAKIVRILKLSSDGRKVVIL